MAHTGIFATSGATLFKAGANHTAISEDQMNEIHKQVESTINSQTRINFSDSYAALNADVQGILSEISSNLTAMYVINYDMSGFTSRSEAQTMLDVLLDGAKRGLALIKDKKQTDFIKGA